MPISANPYHGVVSARKEPLVGWFPEYWYVSPCFPHGCWLEFRDIESEKPTGYSTPDEAISAGVSILAKWYKYGDSFDPSALAWLDKCCPNWQEKE